jgi:sugar phosphate isomerase/epimerase
MSSNPLGGNMLYTRRDVGRIALAAGFGSGFGSKPMAAAKPNSSIKGVQIGCITYSFRSMPEQTAEATLMYITGSGINAVELMAPPINDWARKKGKWDASPAAAAAAAAETVAAGRGGGRADGARGGAAGRVRQQPPSYAPVAGMKDGWGNDQAGGQWNGQTCPAGRGRGAPAAPGVQAPAGAREPAGPSPGGPGPAAGAGRQWRMGLSMDIFKELRKMYNDAGVTVYAVKDLPLDTDEDLEFTFNVGKTLGASHVTVELPAGANAPATIKRMGDAALKHHMFAAYHTHGQGSMTCFDEAFGISKASMANIDLGHMLTNPNAGGTPMDFLNKFHGRTSSVHIKDRTTPAHCGLNLPWGYGETPLKEILELISRNRWPIPASIELEYEIPEGSDAVRECARCLEYCRKILA